MSAIDTASAELNGARMKFVDIEGSKDAVAAILVKTLSYLQYRLTRHLMKVCVIMGCGREKKEKYLHTVFIFYPIRLSGVRI